MQHRILGKTGWRVSAVSMGAWALGGQWGGIEEKSAIDTVHAALDCGVNLIDTADAYGMGQSEVYVGRAVAGRRDNVYLATKVGNWGRRFDDPIQFRSVHSVINCCHASLYRLGVDCIDLYQCHIEKPERPDVFLEAFELLKQQGKIRHFGISTNDLAALKLFNAAGQCAVCQIAYSVLSRSAEADILPYCQENNIGALIRSPLAQGRLTGKFSAESQFDDQVRRHWNKGAARDRYLQSLKTVQQLREFEREDRPLAHVALQFVLAHPAVTCPIPGMKSPEQALENAAAADGALSDEEREMIDRISPPPQSAAIVDRQS